MYSFLLKKEIKEETLVSCYFFYGEETFLAYQFINGLKETLISSENQDFNVDKFNLEDNSWAEVIDLARTIPFFLSPWRIIIVEVKKGKWETLSSPEQRILEAYFSSPPSRTVFVVVFSGKIRKNSSLFKFFSSLPSSKAFSKELRRLREKDLHSWMDKKFFSYGKTATPDAIRRLEEFVGNDLRSVNNEIEKIITFVDDKKVIELDDVNQVSGWIKTFIDWEIAESLVKAEYQQCLVVLDNLIKKEGVELVNILGSIGRFFRDILMAKLLLREKDVDKKAIFKELRPQIHEKFGNFYTTKFKEFFSLVEKFSMKDLNYVLAELQKVDFKIKTSGLNPKTLLESFLSDYCRLREKDRITWKEGR